MATENPILEPADHFYTKTNSETPEPAEKAKPTVEPEVTEADNQDPPEGSENLDNPDEPEVEADSEDSESTDEDETVQVIDLDGEEHTLDDIRTWKNGHLMQSDYTKKTQALAEERKAFEAERDSERENLLKTQSEVASMRDTLEVLVKEDDDIDWAELKEDDPERYIELKEKADKRKEALEKIKAERETPADDPALIADEQKKLFAANPSWLEEKDGKTVISQQYANDIALMNDYAAKSGFSEEEFARMTRAHYLTTILKAAKYDQLQEKGREIKGKRETVPVVTKPKVKVNNQPTENRPMEDVFYSPVSNS